MSPHPVFRLGDIANVVAGDPAPQEPSAFAPDGPMFVRMQDVGLHHVNPALADSVDRLSPTWSAGNRLRLFPKGSILIPKSGASVNLNHRAKLATDAHVVSHLAVVVPDRSRIDPDYLFWWSVRYDPRAQAQVTSLPSLKLSTLKEARVPLPPLDEQRRIVGILNRAAKIERLRAQAAERLQEFIPALFVQMFGDPAENPMGWETRPLGDVIRVSSGQSLPFKNMVPGNYPVYGANGISGYHSEFMFESQKIAIGRVGACGAVHISQPNSWITDNALYVRKILRPINFTYLEWTLRMANLNRYADRATQPLISGSRIYPVEIVIPDEDVQETFCELVRTARATVIASEAGRRAVTILSNSLMSRFLEAGA